MKSKDQMKDLIDVATPEMTLLLMTIRLQREKTSISGLLSALHDWDGLIRQSINHSVLPQLHMYLVHDTEQKLPESIRERLKHLTYQNAARNSHLCHQLRHTLDRLEEHHIPAIPFKGPTLAQWLYGDVALRRFEDLDFLVHRDDMLKVRNIFLAAGLTPHLPMTPNSAKASMRAGWEFIFKDPEESFSIEFDCGIAPNYFSFRIPEKEYWQHLTPVSIDGETYQTLAPEPLLLFLCVHGAKHGWTRLLWILDIAMLLTTQAIDWSSLLTMARRSGSLRMLLLGLLLARDLSDAALPEDVEEMIECDPTLLRLAWQSLLPVLTHAPALAGLEKILFHLLCRERMVDRCRYVFRLVFTPSYSDWQSYALPERLHMLYYLTRPFRLARQVLSKKRKTRLEE